MVADSSGQVLEVLRQALQGSFARCRAWLARRGIRSFEDPLDEAAAQAVLEQAMRAEIAARVEDSRGLTVSVRRMQTDDPTQWCLWVFGAGLWYEQFSRSVLLDDGEGDDSGADRPS